MDKSMLGDFRPQCARNAAKRTSTPLGGGVLCHERKWKRPRRPKPRAPFDLCHGSNSEKVPLCRSAILTPQRLDYASRSKAQSADGRARGGEARSPKAHRASFFCHRLSLLSWVARQPLLIAFHRDRDPA